MILLQKRSTRQAFDCRHIAAAFILILAVCSTSCRSGTENAGTQPVQEQVILPEKAELFHPGTDQALTYPLQVTTPLKIYTVIDAGCASCLIKLRKWNHFKTEIGKEDKVTIIPVCYTKNNFETMKYLVETDSLVKNSLTFLLDTARQFIRQNQSLIDPYGDMTVLTDKNDRILLNGNPLEKTADKEKFIRKIEELTKKP